MPSAMTPEQRKAAIEKITSDWVAVCEAVEAESAEQDARDKRRFSGEPQTAADKAYHEAFKAFADLARTSSLCIDERNHFLESAGVSGLKHGIAYCREKIRRRDEQRKAAGLSLKT